MKFFIDKGPGYAENMRKIDLKETPFLWMNLMKKNIHVLPQPPYSSHLRPCDYFQFPQIKTQLRGRHLRTDENMK